MYISGVASNVFEIGPTIHVFPKLLLWRHAGCTPLHWAAIRGSLEVCTLLVHAGTKQELALKDSGGLTPSQLAADKGQRHLSNILVRFLLEFLFDF